jgi:hypothetical protein
MKKFLVLLLVFFMAACSVKDIQTIDSAATAQTDTREQELRSIIAEADPLIHNLLNALNKGVYTSYIKDFDSSSRAAFTEEQFGSFQEKIKKKLGFYEDGKYQVHKIEQYPTSYVIFYFVKFQNVESRNPAVIAMRVKKTAAGLKVAEISCKHGLLEE